MPRSEEKQFALLSEGEHDFEIFEIGDEVPTKKSHYRTWKFNTDEDGDVQQVWQNLFPWDEIPILESLGYKRDENGGIDWEISDLAGKNRIRATVFHQEYNGKMYAKLKDFKACETKDETIPF